MTQLARLESNPDGGLDRSIATTPATFRQWLMAALIAAASLAVTVLLWRGATTAANVAPGFLAMNQTALIIAHALTAYVLFAHFVESRVTSLLWIGGGALYTAVVLCLQMLSFPHMLAAIRLFGAGPETTSWLWTFAHLGPPVCAIGFAFGESNGLGRRAGAASVSRLLLGVVGIVGLAALGTGLLVTWYVGLLPTIVVGDDYNSLTTSGIGPATEMVTLTALVLLCWTTRIRTTLQLLVALSMLALLMDDAITLDGGSRGSVGWIVGRIEDLVSASFVLGFYLQQAAALHRRVAAALNRLAESHRELAAAHLRLEQQAAMVETSRAELEVARAAAEQANAAKSRFLAGMSHEFRTPLTAILGFADLLLRNDTPEHDRPTFLRLMRDAASALLGQIGSVLDLSKIEAGRLDIEAVPFLPHDLVRGSVELVSQLALQKNLQITTAFRPGLPEAMLGDPARLRQVLLNFLSNAIKFTNEGDISVVVEARRDGADRSQAALRCCVIDTGIGIAATKLPELFEEFRQVDASTARHFGGTGLGLALSRRLIALMGGRCGVDSTLGQGSQFWFEVTLPIVATPPMLLAAHAPAPRQPVAPGSRPPGLPGPVRSGRAEASPPRAVGRATGAGRVLVVDDVHANRLLLQQTLCRLGCEVDQVDGGIAAVEAVRRGGIDLVLMDLQMPDMDGVTAARTIRALGRAGSDIPIIAVTASGSEADVTLCETAGMQDFLIKPVDFARLQAVLERFLPANRVPDFDKARLLPTGAGC